MTPDRYRAAVLDVVRAIPAGRVMAYGTIARYLAEVSGRASPRLVGQIMARCDEVVPWHRVVRADGRPARGLEARALPLIVGEGTPMAGPDRIDMAHALWAPDRPPAAGAAVADDATTPLAPQRSRRPEPGSLPSSGSRADIAQR